MRLRFCASACLRVYVSTRPRTTTVRRDLVAGEPGATENAGLLYPDAAQHALDNPSAVTSRQSAGPDGVQSQPSQSGSMSAAVSTSRTNVVHVSLGVQTAFISALASANATPS